MYDKLTKMNNNGIVKKFKSKNSFIVCINDVDKHVSADNMRLIQGIKTADNKNDEIISLVADNKNDDAISLISDDENDISLISDEESEYEFTNPSQVINNNDYNSKKKYRSEVEKLNAGTPLMMSKTRSGNI